MKVMSCSASSQGKTEYTFSIYDRAKQSQEIIARNIVDLSALNGLL
jgi:hypothetical protein